MSDKVTDRKPLNPVLTEDWFCDVCGDCSGESDDDMVIDHVDPDAVGDDRLKMAHVECAVTRGWIRG